MNKETLAEVLMILAIINAILTATGLPVAWVFIAAYWLGVSFYWKGNK